MDFYELAKAIGPWPALFVIAAIAISFFVSRTVWPFYTDKVWPAKQANEAKKADAQRTESEALKALVEVVMSVREEQRGQLQHWNRRFDNMESGQRTILDRVGDMKADISVLFDRMEIARPSRQERAEVKAENQAH